MGCGNDHRVNLPRCAQPAVVGKFCPGQVIYSVQMADTESCHLHACQGAEHSVISAAHDAQPDNAHADCVHTHSLLQASSGRSSGVDALCRPRTDDDHIIRHDSSSMAGLYWCIESRL
jgi:hypothetical protein